MSEARRFSTRLGPVDSSALRSLSRRVHAALERVVILPVREVWNEVFGGSRRQVLTEIRVETFPAWMVSKSTSRIGKSFLRLLLEFGLARLRGSHA